jgi:hypothetical protein
MGDKIITSPKWWPDADSFMQEHHLRSSDRDLVDKLLEEAAAWAGPQGGYLALCPESCTADSVCLNDIRLHSKLLARHLATQDRVFPFVATCGPELAAWVDSKEDMLENYLAHALSEQATHLVAEALRQDIEDCYGLKSLSRMQPGSLPDWPLEEQKPLFNILGSVADRLKVRLTGSSLMLPTVSLSGIYFQDPEGFISCQLCTRQCPRRKAPFDRARWSRLQEE